MASFAKSKFEPSLLGRMKSLVNNKFLSDVTFLVGPKQTKVYAHRTILALGSTVFEKMFYGDLKTNCDQPIEITDLTPIGLTNMFKKIYGHEICSFLEFMDFYETYKAGDKYLVTGFTDSLIAYAEEQLNVNNCLILFDQLSKLELDELTNKVKRFIVTNANRIFKSVHFTEIDEDLLIKLLNFESLIIDEREIIDACIRWVNCELVRRNCKSPTPAAKREVSRTIKKHIKFSDLSFHEFGKCTEIDSLLTNEEIGSLYMHLINKFKTLTIECQTSRKRFGETSSKTTGFKESIVNYGFAGLTPPSFGQLAVPVDQQNATSSLIKPPSFKFQIPN